MSPRNPNGGPQRLKNRGSLGDAVAVESTRLTTGPLVPSVPSSTQPPQAPPSAGSAGAGPSLQTAASVPAIPQAQAPSRALAAARDGVRVTPLGLCLASVAMTARSLEGMNRSLTEGLRLLVHHDENGTLGVDSVEMLVSHLSAIESVAQQAVEAVERAVTRERELERVRLMEEARAAEDARRAHVAPQPQAPGMSPAR